MFWLKLSWKSLLNRRLTAGLTLFSIAFSVALVLTIDRIRVDTRSSFTNTLSGTDLVVGARTGSLNLLLYTVFRIGNASNNIAWESYQNLAKHPAVKWTVPMSLGDSHKGYRVLGTSPAYFTHYQYGRQKNLSFSQGQPFETPRHVVLGSEVAKALDYQLGDKIILSHGIGKTSFANHDNHPFEIIGILDKTATPVDQTVHVSLEAIELIHLGWDKGVKPRITQQQDLSNIPDPKSITAFLVGMNSRIKTFAFQRLVNEYPNDTLMAIIPGATLQTLWRTLANVEKALLVISLLVVASGLLGMLAVILSSLNERRREIALFRAMGVPSRQVYLLLCGESFLYGLGGVIIGLILHYLTLFGIGGFIEAQYGITLSISLLSVSALSLLLGVTVVAGLLGLIPATQAYRQTLIDGLTIRI